MRMHKSIKIFILFCIVNIKKTWKYLLKAKVGDRKACLKCGACIAGKKCTH